jgi:predicted RNA binding protein YcfA (HicA-like mRNA interferase family)
MSRKHHSRKTREVIRKLREDGWTIARKGPGDHVQWKHPTKRGLVTVNMDEPEIPTGTLRNIYRAAEWEW